MNRIYQVYQVSDSTGETLERIFLAIKAQFSNFNCKAIPCSFTRTVNQVNKIIEKCKSEQNVIILYTIVEESLAKHLALECKKNNIPCFEVLGKLISDFSKLLEQKASHRPIGQHILDKEYYKRIEAIQFTMTHDDGKIISDLEKSDIILVGVSRTSKTPTSVYLANRGYRTSNIPVIPNKNLPEKLELCSKKICIVGLVCDPIRLSDVRRNRTQPLHKNRSSKYINEKEIINELESSKKLFKEHNWPIIDVTRKSVEETAASVIKIFDILNSK